MGNEFSIRLFTPESGETRRNVAENVSFLGEKEATQLESMPCQGHSPSNLA